MSETLTDEHHDWATKFTGVDTREDASGGSPPPPAAEAATPAPAPDVPAAPAPEEPTSGGVFGALSDLAHRAADTVSNAASAVKDTVVKAEHAVEEVAGEVKDKAVEVAGEVKDKVVEVAGEVKDKAVEVAGEVKDAVVGAEHAVEKGISDAYQAVKTAITGKAPLPPDVPTARADEKMKSLPPEDQKKVQALMDNAKSDQEKRYLTKGLAAGHTPAELEEFAKKINGKDDKWLNDHLRLVGDSQGKGIKQQWSFSCAPTTVEAIKGELDPLYAMKLREENPNFEDADDAKGDKMNPKMAEDQRAMLEGGHGVATSRDDPEQKGRGMVFKTLLNGQSGDTGLTYDSKVLGSDTTVDEALNTMSDGVKKGVPVPITVGDAAHPYAHAALVTAVDDGPPRTFTIHDPWYGKTETFTEDQIKNDKVNVGDWHHVGVVFPPSIKK